MQLQLVCSNLQVSAPFFVVSFPLAMCCCSGLLLAQVPHFEASAPDGGFISSLVLGPLCVIDTGCHAVSF